MSERPPWYTYLPLLVFPFILFAPTILSGRALFWGTPLTQFIPWWTWAWEAIMHGVFPLWNNMLGMGAPLIANYQSALFYPPTWLYFVVYTVGGISAMAWFQAVMVVLHISWAAFGMALLIKQLKLGILAQIVGGMAFGLSGYLVARAGFLSINAAAAWLPWIILGVTKLIEELSRRSWLENSGTKPKVKRRFRLLSAFLLLVACLTMQLLAGHAQITWYTMVLASIWVLYLLKSHPWKAIQDGSAQIGEPVIPEWVQTTSIPSKQSRNSLRKFAFHPMTLGLVLFGAAILFAVGLAAIQLFPTAEYLLQSQRSAAVDYEFAMSYSFWPWRILSLIAPDLFGNPSSGDYWGFANYWEDAIYIGLIPFVLAITALLTRGKRVRDKSMVGPQFVLFLFILILVSFILALGRNTPIFPWLYRNVPTFDMFQAPTRISFLAVFCLSILAAIGADSWFRPGDKRLYWIRLGIMAAAAITIGAGIALLVSQSLPLEIRPSLIRGTAMLGIWGIGIGVLTLKAPRNSNSETVGRGWGWWQWAVVIWLGLDLVVAGWGLNPGVDLSVYRESSQTAVEIKSILNGGRLYLSAEDEELLKFERFLRFDTFQPFQGGGGWQDLHAVQLPNVTILDAIPSANNFDPLIPGRYSDWMEKLSTVSLDTQQQMLNLMGVTVVESIDLNQPYGVRFDQITSYPRLRWAACGIFVENGIEALELISSNQVNFEDEVIIEPLDESTADICMDQLTPVIQTKTSIANRTDLKLETSNPGYLIIGDVWYPGWRAFVDSIPVPILRANYLFRAIVIPSGEHEVSIIYQPRWFYFGAALSVLALFGLIFLGFYWLGIKRLAEKY
jgi:hypothetical protein